MAHLDEIRGLAEYHATRISSSPRDWMNYLDTAARLYRYPFMDQLLIHAQRPKATACASLELWNEKMLRWVNRGAKGIALLDETIQKTRLRYVFDIQDTHKVKGGRTPYLWRLQEKQQEELLNHLEEVYGLEVIDTGSLSDALMATAKYMVEENLDEYLDGLTYVMEGTYLEELEEDTIRSEFRSLLTDSIYYTLASRCGLDPLERQEEMDFVHITDYNSLSVLTFIGNATSMASESVLVDIGRFVHRISLEEMKKGGGADRLSQAPRGRERRRHQGRTHPPTGCHAHFVPAGDLRLAQQPRARCGANSAGASAAAGACSGRNGRRHGAERPGWLCRGRRRRDQPSDGQELPQRPEQVPRPHLPRRAGLRPRRAAGAGRRPDEAGKRYPLARLRPTQRPR